MVNVLDTQTGQVHQVDESQLGQFGLSAPQTAANLPTQPQPQQQGGGFLSNLIHGITNPFVGTAKTIGGAGYELENKLANLFGYQNQKGQQFDPARDNPFLTQQETQQYDTNPGQAMLNQVGRSAAIASYAIPFGGQGASAFGHTIFPAASGIPGLANFGMKFLAPGAAVGAAQAAGQQDNPTLGGVAMGGLTGAAGAGVLGGLGNLFNKGGQSLASDASKGISKATAGDIEKGINAQGVNPNDLVKQYVPAGKNYNDLLGPTAARGKGGILGGNMNAAEKTLQDAVQQSGSTLVATRNDLLTPLYAQRNALAGTVGNETKISALDAAIAEVEQKFSTGATAQQLLDMKRAADSQFGKAVVEDTKGAITSQVQKMLGNTARGILKERVPGTADALQTQAHMFTLQDLFNGARAKSLAPPSELATGGVPTLALNKPQTFLEAPYKMAMNNPSIASRFLGAGNGITNPTLSAIAGQAPRVPGVLGGSLFANPTNQGGQTPTNQEQNQNNLQQNNQLGGSIPQSTGTQPNDSLVGATIDGQPISPGMADLIRKVANYEMDLTKVTSLRTDQRQKLAEYVSQYDPTFDMTQYAARAAIRKDFTSGKSAASIRSLNTAIGHLASLQQAGQELGNTGIPLLNTIKNTAAQQAGQAAPVKFNNAANAVAGEMSTVFKGISGTDQEIKSWREQMNAAQSPAQIQAGIDQMIELMGSRLQAFDAQWNSGINKPKDFAFLSPKSRQILTGLGVDVNSLDPLSQYNPNQ